MKRVLTFATTGLFLTGLALLPMSARADQTATGGKDGKPVAGKTTTMSGTPAPAPAAKTTGEKNVTAPASSTAPATGHSAVKTPAKGAS